MTKQPKLSRTLSRLLAVQALYAAEVSGETIDTNKLDEVMANTAEASEEDPDQVLKSVNVGFFKTLVRLSLLHTDSIDEKIVQATSRNQAAESLDVLIRAVLRSGTCELLYCPTPPKVVVNEYTNLANEFFGAKEVAFVNAVLDKIARSKHEPTESEAT